MQVLTTSPPAMSLMSTRPRARFGIAVALLVVAFPIASAADFGATETAWAVVLAAGLLAAGLALPVSMVRIHHVIKENSHG